MASTSFGTRGLMLLRWAHGTSDAELEDRPEAELLRCRSLGGRLAIIMSNCL